MRHVVRGVQRQGLRLVHGVRRARVRIAGPAYTISLDCTMQYVDFPPRARRRRRRRRQRYIMETASLSTIRLPSPATILLPSHVPLSKVLYRRFFSTNRSSSPQGACPSTIKPFLLAGTCLSAPPAGWFASGLQVQPCDAACKRCRGPSAVLQASNYH